MIDGLVLQEVISLATGNSDQLVEKRAAPESGGPRRSGQHQYAGQGEDLRGEGATSVPEDRIRESFGGGWSWDGFRHSPKATFPEEGIGWAAEEWLA